MKLTKEQKKAINDKYKTPDAIAQVYSDFTGHAISHWTDYLNDEYGDAADWAYENLDEKDLWLLLDTSKPRRKEKRDEN